MAKSRRRYICEDSVLMQEWDVELNHNFDANKLVRSSNVKVNWKCKECGYRWQTAIYNRTHNHTGCPRCANSILIIGENDLATTHPLLAKEWHEVIVSEDEADAIGIGKYASEIHGAQHQISNWE